MVALRNMAAVAALVRGSSAAMISVDVGPNNMLAYSPNSFKANVGDTVQFTFHPLNHSVVMGDFNNPCQPAATNPFFSGFMPVSSGTGPNVFTINITTTDPIPFYCAQPAFTHCKSGMVGVINPSSTITADAFASAAKNAQGLGAPASVQGGVVGPASSSSGSSSSPSSSAAPAASSSSSSNSGGGGLYGSGGGSSSGSTPSAAGMVGASMALVMGAAAGVAVLLA